MPQDVETAASASATQSPPPSSRLVPGTAIAGGRYTINELSRSGPFAEIYRATQASDNAPFSVHLIHPDLVSNEQVAAAMIKGCEAAKAVDHKNLLSVHEVVREDVGIIVVTEYIDGNPLTDLLARKRELGSAGFAPRGAGNILGGICNAIAATSGTVPHGCLSADSVYVSSSGRVKVADFGIAFTKVAAARTGAMAAAESIAPEVASSGRPSVAGDLYSTGRLLYAVLVGDELVKGGRRPSEIEGVPAVVDQIVARCVGPADQRPPSADALKKAITDAIARRSGQQAAVRPSGATASTRPSLAQSIARPSGQMPAAGSDTGIAIQPSGGGAPTPPRPSASVNAADPLSDTEERWLISKGKMDFGPFSMAAIAEKIRTNEILPGHVLVDKNTGARATIEDNPLLVPLVEAAKQSRDDQRRAQAEVSHAKIEKRKGFALYGFIGIGVLVIGLGTFFLYKKLGAGSKGKKAKVVTGEGGIGIAESYEKDKTKRKKRRRYKRRSRSGGKDDGPVDEGNNMDFADENDESGGARLSDGQINNTIQSNAGGLIRCKQKHGSGLVKFSVGGNGRVQWVKVDGKRRGSLYHCVKKAMSRIQFPKFDGKRTRGTLPL